MFRHIRSALPFVLLAVGTFAQAQDTAPKIDAAGTVSSPAARIPFSSFASKQSLTRFGEIFHEGKAAPPLGQDIQASRAFYDKINTDRAERMKKLYPVEIVAQKFGGVAADVVTPKGGVDKRNAQRVLINLHGGAFLWGAGSGGLVEAIPVASVGKIKVVTIDYRQGPEHVFPAASEDVEKVYRELLKTYAPQNIGIYGCSAGGILTAEAVAWLQTRNLPAPGAIGIFCAGVIDLQGDSAYAGHLLMGEAVPEHTRPLTALPYFKGADPADPLVLPGVSPAAEEISADAAGVRLARFRDERNPAQQRAADRGRRENRAACLGRRVAFVLLRSGVARIQGDVRRRRAFLRS